MALHAAVPTRGSAVRAGDLGRDAVLALLAGGRAWSMRVLRAAPPAAVRDLGARAAACLRGEAARAALRRLDAAAPRSAEWHAAAAELQRCLRADGLL